MTTTTYLRVLVTDVNIRALYRRMYD